MLTIKLTPLPASTVRGIYGRAHDTMPERMRLLHPDAARDFAPIASWAIVSDMFRTPESSLAAVRAGRGAQPPGYSAHNYGLAVDLALDDDRKEHGDGALTLLGRHLGLGRRATKRELDLEMEGHGWFCHRRDHVMGFEAWHYNHGIAPAGKLTSDEIEARIVELYGAALAPDDAECQRLLTRLGCYHGEIDGDIGPRSREAARAFERAWGLNVDGVLDKRTRRTLAYVACDREIMVEAAAA
jgi:hypothetical protein